MDEHLGFKMHQVNKCRNGHITKKIKTSLGETEIQVPRDRDSSFTPIVVPKRKNMIDGLENIIISFYAKGMSVSDIQEQIKELYEFELSTSSISRITDKVTEEILTWKNRPLEPVYLIVWMDGWMDGWMALYSRFVKTQRLSIRPSILLLDLEWLVKKKYLEFG